MVRGTFNHTRLNNKLVSKRLPSLLPSSSPSPIPTQQTKSLIEKKILSSIEKEIPTTYFYFVMELCKPESLRDRLIQRSIDRHQAWAIFDQIVKGIEYIHSQKLVRKSYLFKNQNEKNLFNN